MVIKHATEWRPRKRDANDDMNKNVTSEKKSHSGLGVSLFLQNRVFAGFHLVRFHCLVLNTQTSNARSGLGDEFLPQQRNLFITHRKNSPSPILAKASVFLAILQLR
jgi:hypothetical protein